MSQLTVALPESVSEGEAKLYLAMKLFEVGRLSCGQAAELADYSKQTFMELLGKHGIAALSATRGHRLRMALVAQVQRDAAESCPDGRLRRHDVGAIAAQSGDYSCS